MKTDVSTAKKVLGVALGSLMLVPFGVSAAGPIGSTLQTEANVGTAAAGNADPVIISVLVTKSNGLPTPSLAPDDADGPLPNGWTLITGFNQPELGVTEVPPDPEDCKLVVTAFNNFAAGVYTFDATPDPAGPTCTWVAGTYHYAIRVDDTVPSVGRFRGTTIGVFEIVP